MLFFKPWLTLALRKKASPLLASTAKPPKPAAKHRSMQKVRLQRAKPMLVATSRSSEVRVVVKLELESGCHVCVHVCVVVVVNKSRKSRYRR